MWRCWCCCGLGLLMSLQCGLIDMEAVGDVVECCHVDDCEYGEVGDWLLPVES